MNIIEAMKQARNVLLTLDSDLIVEVTKLNAAIDALDDAIDYAESEWPVAWMNEEGAVTTDKKWARMQNHNKPLYEQPQPKREPLTALQITKLFDGIPKDSADMFEFARAIEAAHGITASEAEDSAKGEA